MYSEKYMDIAIKQAKKAKKKGEIPVGAVIVYKNKVIAKAYNKKECFNSALKHAEILAIEKANKKLKNWRLLDCDIYITLEPCPMCASAMEQSRIRNVFYGAKNKNDENNKIIQQIICNKHNNGVTKLQFVEKRICSKILSDFFENRR